MSLLRQTVAETAETCVSCGKTLPPKPHLEPKNPSNLLHRILFVPLSLIGAVFFGVSLALINITVFDSHPYGINIGFEMATILPLLISAACSWYWAWQFKPTSAKVKPIV